MRELDGAPEEGIRAMSVGTMGSATAAPAVSTHVRQRLVTTPWRRLARDGASGFAEPAVTSQPATLAASSGGD